MTIKTMRKDEEVCMGRCCRRGLPDHGRFGREETTRAPQMKNESRHSVRRENRNSR